MKPNKTAPTTADFKPLIALYNARRYAELENQVRTLLAQHPNAPFAWQLLGGVCWLGSRSRTRPVACITFARGALF